MFIHEKSITLHIGHQNSSQWENLSISELTSFSQIKTVVSLCQTSSASSTWYFHFLKRKWMNVIRILINGFMF